MTGLRFAVVLLVFLGVVLVAGVGMTRSVGATLRRRRDRPNLDQHAPTPPEDLPDDSTPSRSDDL